jgi:hypothetical protein
MMNELTEYLKEGGAKEVFTRYAVEIGDALWSALYSHIEKAYPDAQNCYCSVYRIEGIFEDNGQKFAVLQSRSDMKYYRLNFALTEETGFVPSDTLIEVTKSYTPAEEPQFALEAVEEFETEYAERKKGEEEDKDGEEVIDNSEEEVDDETEINPDCDEIPEEVEETTEEEIDDNNEGENNNDVIEVKYVLEDVVEYTELMVQYNELTEKFNALEAEHEALKAEIEPLKEFKLEAEKKDKQAMIDQFYMLSDDDKADVIANIDTYSVDDIEAKLSIICVRNKVSFNLDDNTNINSNPTVYNLNGGDTDDANVPAWVKSLRETAKTM